MRSLLWSALVGGAVVGGIGCAQGITDADDVEAGLEQTAGSVGGADAAGGAGGQLPLSSGGGFGGSVATGGAGGLGGGGSEASGGAGGAGGSASTCDFSPPNSCLGATTLTAIAGDKNSDVRTESGVGSRWFEVYVDDVFGGDSYESYTVSLISPAGMDYDVFVYEGDLFSPMCNATGVRGTGTPESHSNAWADVGFQEDDRWLSIEVRHVSGDDCEPSAKWTLTVAGHTP